MTEGMRRIAGFAGIATIGAVMVLAVGCGGGSSSNDKIDTSNIDLDSKVTPNAAGEQIIEIKDGSFDPATVTIKAGTKVIWKWAANTACAIQMSGATATEQSSGTYERLFSTGGSTYSYQCAGKPDMAGKITVE